jgi:hypothetical protein
MTLDDVLGGLVIGLRVLVKVKMQESGSAKATRSSEEREAILFYRSIAVKQSNFPFPLGDFAIYTMSFLKVRKSVIAISCSKTARLLRLA